MAKNEYRRADAVMQAALEARAELASPLFLSGALLVAAEARLKLGDRAGATALLDEAAANADAGAEPGVLVHVAYVRALLLPSWATSPSAAAGRRGRLPADPAQHAQAGRAGLPRPHRAAAGARRQLPARLRAAVPGGGDARRPREEVGRGAPRRPARRPPDAPGAHGDRARAPRARDRRGRRGRDRAEEPAAASSACARSSGCRSRCASSPTATRSPACTTGAISARRCRGWCRWPRAATTASS